jgi:hypothetical protein
MDFYFFQLTVSIKMRVTIVYSKNYQMADLYYYLLGKILFIHASHKRLA